MSTYDLTISVPTSLVKNDIVNIPYSGTIKNTTCDYGYTGGVQSVTLSSGTYKLECWGAEGGGDGVTYKGGKGGYSQGTLKVVDQVTLYIAVGGAGKYVRGSSASTGETFNGGGKGVAYSDSSSTSGSGGGCTSIQTSLKGDGQLSNYESVKDTDVLIVAGGGGAGNYCNGSNYGAGGYGGGESGCAAINLGAGDWRANKGAAATGGTQTGGGQFGKATEVSDAGNSYCGAGGGWYGGIGSGFNGAGGGSGHIGAMLTEGSTIAGNTEFLSPDGSKETGHSGNGCVRITVLSLSKVRKKILNFSYTGKGQSVTLNKGTYTLEAWGASGGDEGTTSGGNGGYSVGTLSLDSTKTLYLYVGGQATSITGGYNGGGSGLVGSQATAPMGGGGCTHIATADGVLSSLSNNKDAVILVAGGGGGSPSSGITGGSGGGLTGKDGGYNGSYPNYRGTGGTQTAGGNQIAEAGTAGLFGQGSNGYGQYGGAGGGGGYYGGGGTNRNHSGAGGGSGFISSSLTNASTLDGDNSFVSPEGISEKGHDGNGYIRITYYVSGLDAWVKVKGEWKEVTEGFVKVNGEWKEISGISKKIKGSWYA